MSEGGCCGELHVRYYCGEDRDGVISINCLFVACLVVMSMISLTWNCDKVQNNNGERKLSEISSNTG